MKRKVFLLLLCLLFVSCSAHDDYDDGDYYDGTITTTSTPKKSTR